MENSEKIKTIVKEKYGEIVKKSEITNEASCCESSSCCTTDYEIICEDYSMVKGYKKEADLGLGCGLPTEYARIKEGNTVLDLGSGAGNDVFIARDIVGESGKVIGIDMTREMIEKAQENNKKLSYNNVEFLYSEIENMSLNSATVDVVVSNCVLNLVPDKKKAFDEIYRVLKSGGHFSISDIVTSEDIPDSMKSAAELYAGCVSGAITKTKYLDIIKKAGFNKITIQNERVISLPDEFLKKYLSDEEIKEYKDLNVQIISINIYAEKHEASVIK